MCAKQKIIAPNEHVFIGGKTGSGKTFLAKKYLAGYPNVVALDTKGTLNWDEIKKEDLVIVKHLRELSFVTKQKIIYRPVWEEMTPEYYDKFFKWCYKRRNCIVWVDEAMSVSPNPYRIPEYYKAILTRGRELNVAVWSLSQRPSGIANVIMSESTHFFIFDLNMPADRLKLAEITGCREILDKPSGGKGGMEKFAFWYFNVEEDRPVKAKLVETGRKGRVING